MTGQRLLKVETKRDQGPYNQISLEFIPGMQDDFSSAAFRECSGVITKDQFDAPRFKFLVDEFSELIRELVVQ